MHGTMASQRTVYAVNDSIMVLYGISSVMIGTTLPEMIGSLDLSLSEGGLVVSLQNAGGIVALFAATVIADKVSKARWVVGSFLALGLVLFGIGLVGSYVELLAAFFVSGVAIRLLDIMLNSYTGDVAGVGRPRAMNLLHMFFSLGAFTGPLVAAGLLTAGLDWRLVYRLVGGLSVVAAVAGLPAYRSYGAAAAAREDAPPSGTADLTRLHILRHPEVIVLGAVLLLYAVHQTGATAWLPYYLSEDSGAGTAAAGGGLSLYWVGIIVSRFVASRLTERVGAKRILVVGAILGAGATAVSLLTSSVIGFVVAGLLTGATIPLAMIVAYGLLPERTGSVTAVLSIFMLVGRLLGPWLIGAIADAAGISAGMIVVAASLACAGIAAGIVGKG